MKLGVLLQYWDTRNDVRLLVTKQGGGAGAVREVCDLLCQARKS